PPPPHSFPTRRSSDLAATRLGLLPVDIRKRHVSDAVMTRDSPQNPAERTAFADARLPNDFAVLIRVEGMHHTRLLTRHQHLLALDRKSTRLNSSHSQI